MRKARAVRESCHLSLRQVEAATGIDHSVIGKFERGESGLTVDNLLVLSAFYKCSIDTLVAEGTPEPAAQGA